MARGSIRTVREIAFTGRQITDCNDHTSGVGFATSSASHIPASASWIVLAFSYVYSSTEYAAQIAFKAASGGDVYTRVLYSSGWSSWKKVTTS